MTSLSITIPTYNRIEELKATLGALLPLVQGTSVEVLVLDNCSDCVMSEEMRARLGDACDHVRFVRHSGNIGLAGNLLRCLELATGDWVWLLGDDDPPLADCLQAIFSAMEEAEADDVLLKFNSRNGGEVARPERITSLHALALRCRDARFYSNLLFISSSVFRRRAMQERLNIGVHWAVSIAPHIAMLIDAMASGAAVRLVPVHVVRHGRQPAARLWNQIRLQTGFPALGDLENGGEFAELAMPKIAFAYLGRNWWRRMASCFLRDSSRSPRFWLSFFLRYAAVVGGWRGFLMAQYAGVFYLLGCIGFLRLVGRIINMPVDSTRCLDRS